MHIRNTTDGKQTEGRACIQTSVEAFVVEDDLEHLMVEGSEVTGHLMPSGNDTGRRFDEWNIRAGPASPFLPVVLVPIEIGVGTDGKAVNSADARRNTFGHRFKDAT